jgi:hypothetical protein
MKPHSIDKDKIVGSNALLIYSNKKRRTYTLKCLSAPFLLLKVYCKLLKYSYYLCSQPCVEDWPEQHLLAAGDVLGVI